MTKEDKDDEIKRLRKELSEMSGYYKGDEDKEKEKIKVETWIIGQQVSKSNLIKEIANTEEKEEIIEEETEDGEERKERDREGD